MKCQHCGKDVAGEILVSEDEVAGCVVIRMEPTPDRNWIACDSCNTLVCHDCCQYPESGYCNACIARYRLKGYLVEEGLIKEE